MSAKFIIGLVVILSASFTANAQPIERTARAACYVNGKKGVYVVEDGNGHMWCKVGNRETECGGRVDACSDTPLGIRLPPKTFGIHKNPLNVQ